MRPPARFRSPVRVVFWSFLAAIAIGTVLLSLPVASAPGRHTSVVDAAFTSVSATCVTGLITVDTATQWSLFGKIVILALIQVGGFGVMTLATLLTMAVTGRLGLGSTLVAQSQVKSALGAARKMPQRIAIAMLLSELVIAVVLTLRFALGHGQSWPSAIWHGIFHAVSAFNNAGFALWTDNLIGVAADAWIIFPLCAAVVAGGLGFPVYFELIRRGRLFHPSRWSVHARLTVGGTIGLLIIGTVLFGAYEWNNPATLGPMDTWGKLINAVAGGVFPRTAGFNTIDYAHASEGTFALYYVLMFIGGGSAGTAGGIKISTFLLLAFVIWSEIRGEPHVHIGHRRIGTPTMRQALTVALLGLALIAAGTAVLLAVTDHDLSIVLFETISAFGTVGVSAGITAGLPASAKLTLMVMMFCGRIGAITVASALAVRRRHDQYDLPEERPIVG
ncbi:TrkH family potassium uptake protein [Enemella sp. A6]|uniref:TrkH family potassium uptake protein n=1 Tax=Enemella sp. A6 TaxID=3440152 RepID=UPI003EBA84B0